MEKLLQKDFNLLNMENLSEADLNCNLEDYLAMADLQSADLEELLNLLKSRTNYYREETAKMESAFLKLHIINERLKMFEECVDLIEKLNHLQHNFDLKELTPNAVALSHAHKLRKHNNYASKLKICLKMYIELNESLTKKIKQLKSTHEQAQKKIDQIVTASVDDMKTIEKKISRYENELSKLEKKYPWLKNNEYNLPNISKEINLLIAARTEKEELVKELNVYCGLKPDLQQATQQLSQIKLEYEEMNKKLLEK